MPYHQEPFWANSVLLLLGLSMQENHFDSSSVAQHALVLGLGYCIKPNTSVAAKPADTTFNQIPHKNMSNLNLHAWLKEQGISEVVAA